MTPAIHWYDEAIADLTGIVACIAERDPQAAQRLRDRIEAAVELVAGQPYMAHGRSRAWPRGRS